MVLSIIFLEDKHTILLHLSIFYEYQQFFQHRIYFSIQPPDYSDPWPTLARSTSLFLIMLFNESEFLQKLVKDKKIHEARAFNFTYRYIDDVLSINNSRFAEFLPGLNYSCTALQINLREYHKGNQKWKIQRNWQHRIQVTKKSNICGTSLYVNKHK